MNKPIATFTGTVARDASVITPAKGKPYVGLALKGSPNEWNGKSYSERVSVRLYTRDHDFALSELKAGATITVTGEDGAFIREGTNPRAYVEIVTFRYSLFEPAEVDRSEGERSSPPPQRQREVAPPQAEPPAELPPGTPEDDDVPF